MESQAAEVVVAEFGSIPGESMGRRWVGNNARIAVMKSYKHVLPEGTTLTINEFSPRMWAYREYTTTPSTDITTIGEKIDRLIKVEESSASVCIIFLEHGSGVSVGKSRSEMHPLNGNEWAALRSDRAVIPISRDISLETPQAKSIAESVETLVNREWERRRALGELDRRKD